MNDPEEKVNQLVAECYEKYRHPVFLYVYYKTGKKEESEDLTQDAFARLLEYRKMLCEETVKHFLFTIARNLVTDYLRRHYRRQEVAAYLYESGGLCSDETESGIVARDLQKAEYRRVASLPMQRRIVYAMNRFQGKTSDEIALRLNLSKRTVENHLFISRKEVREYIKQCI